MTARGLLFVYRCCAVDESDDDSCWIWQQTTNQAGYPIARMDTKRQISVRRRVYELWTATTLRKDRFISMTCGHLRCVNPDHALIVTKSGYMRARGPTVAAASGRLRESRRRRAKLNIESVRTIRQRIAAGSSYTQLAAEYAVSRSAVQQVAQHKIWREPSPWAI